MAGCRTAVKTTFKSALKPYRFVKRLLSRKKTQKTHELAQANEPAKFGDAGESVNTENQNSGRRVELPMQLIEKAKDFVLHGRRLEVEEAGYRTLMDALNHKLSDQNRAMLDIEFKLGQADVSGDVSESQVAK